MNPFEIFLVWGAVGVGLGLLWEINVTLKAIANHLNVGRPRAQDFRGDFIRGLEDVSKTLGLDERKRP